MSPINVSSSPVFNRDASGYDVLRRGLIPCFDAFYGTALDLIDDWRHTDKLRVLDLGAGTGLFSAMLLARHPDAQIHLVDASEKMLEQARQRFDGNPAITYAVADMADAELGGPWDLIISALAIHHLEDAAKKHLFGGIRGALSEGGLFVNAEQVLGHDSEVEARYARIWLQQVRTLGIPEAEIAKAHERMSHDRCSSVESQLQWMRDTGLCQVDCSFKAWRFAVLSGLR
ncbi:methyltransferase domain-containing protein [Rhizobium sp. BK060]|uniref:methyltransferase domain-containing protein n=1 Tax=Rhizobium sp. BK060 TaxID=2587096 RepID=UPI0016125226|nr:methyltransferase domain-containing protein [Rhizobium sp. BK060]